MDKFIAYLGFAILFFLLGMSMLGYIHIHEGDIPR